MPKVKGKDHYNWKHGQSGTKLHFIWIEMRQRCENPEHKRFMLYGARGICVCSEWHDFGVFHKWSMENGYTEGLSIERKDNNGSYEPNNCRWATQKEQTNNTRRSKLIEYQGMTCSLATWSEVLSMNYNVLRSRLRIGWSPKKAFETPERVRHI